MTKQETETLRSQNVTFKKSLNDRKYLIKVFISSSNLSRGGIHVKVTKQNQKI